jgi:hypothetical protein
VNAMTRNSEGVSNTRLSRAFLAAERRTANGER